MMKILTRRFAVVAIVIAAVTMVVRLEGLGAAMAVASRPDSCRLIDTWTSIAHDATGSIAVAARHVERGESAALNGAAMMQLQSVFKVPIALAVLRDVDAHRLSLDAVVNVGVRDLSPGVSPIATRVQRGGTETTTVRRLIEGMLIESDNTSADVLMRQIGGPLSVQKYLRDNSADGIDVSLYERQNAEIYVGLPFPSTVANPLAAFRAAVAAASPEHLRAAAVAYGADRRNAATAEAFSRFLARLQRGELATPASTSLVLGWMTASTPYPTRLKGALPPGTLVAHKPGTSGTTEGVTAVTNDAGIVTLPDGTHLAVTVFIRNATGTSAANDAIIARLGRAAYDCWTDGRTKQGGMS